MDFIRIIIAILLPPLGVFRVWRGVLVEHSADVVRVYSGDRACGVHHRQALSTAAPDR
jgi:hypothetical protein